MAGRQGTRAMGGRAPRIPTKEKTALGRSRKGQRKVGRVEEGKTRLRGSGRGLWKGTGSCRQLGGDRRPWRNATASHWGEQPPGYTPAPLPLLPGCHQQGAFQRPRCPCIHHTGACGTNTNTYLCCERQARTPDVNSAVRDMTGTAVTERGLVQGYPSRTCFVEGTLALTAAPPY